MYIEVCLFFSTNCCVNEPLLPTKHVVSTVCEIDLLSSFKHFFLSYRLVRSMV
jgi:hypothetical protein